MTEKIECYKCEKVIAIYLGHFKDDWEPKKENYLRWIRCLECEAKEKEPI